MNPEQLWETTMNPEIARLKRITIDDCESAANALEICMSNNVEARREYILQNL
jgi:DNA gyrase subunit B